MRQFLCVTATLLVTSVASGSGLYNMPTNLRQCLGVGFGPGYHAPLILSVPLTPKTASQGIKWRGPMPPSAHNGFGEPSVWIDSAPGHHAPVHNVPVHQAPGHYPPVQYAPAHHGTPSTSPTLVDPYSGYEVVPSR